MERVDTFHCPVTLNALSYAEFREALTNPDWGRSDFQVGHLNPLKAGIGVAGTGHCADNIAWISSDGNRIQGHLSLDETRQLIVQIAQNYRNQGAL